MRPGLGVLDMSIMTECDFRLENGHFELSQRLKMYRLEDRLSYIFANFSQSPSPGLPNGSSWWGQLKMGIKLRNQLVHPKTRVQVNEVAVATALTAILDCLDALYREIYARPFPPFKRVLNSALTF